MEFLLACEYPHRLKSVATFVASSHLGVVRDAARTSNFCRPTAGRRRGVFGTQNADIEKAALELQASDTAETLKTGERGGALPPTVARNASTHARH